MNALFVIGLVWFFLEFVSPKMTNGNVELTPGGTLAPLLAKLYAVLTVCLTLGGLVIAMLIVLSVIHGAPVTEVSTDHASAFFARELICLQVMLTAALCITARAASSIIRVTNWKWAAYASFPLAIVMAAHSTLQFIAG
jgi:hypothetical protein